jgi:hypothetical protein
MPLEARKNRSGSGFRQALATKYFKKISRMNRNKQLRQIIIHVGCGEATLMT